MMAHLAAWLDAHPERSDKWLEEKIAEGLYVHHLNGNHNDNDPLNLVLIECGDHMMLHNGVKRFSRVVGVNRGGGRPRKVANHDAARIKSLRKVIAELDVGL